MRDSKEVEKKPKLDKFMSFSETNTLEPVERLKGLFINANVIYYPQIKSRFPELDDEQLLKQLSNVAVCIRGLWISQSHLLYMDRPFDARQYLLGMFLQSETISRKMFADVVRLPYDMVQNLLLEIAVLDQETRTWSLKLPSDEEFMERALDSFSSKQKTTVVQKQIPHRQSAPKTQPSTESKMIYPLTGKDSSSQAQNLIKEIFKTRGVVSRDEIHSIFEAQQKRSNQPPGLTVDDKASKIQTVTSEEIDKIIDGLSIPFINDYLVLKSSGNDLLDAFRITTMKYFMEKTKVKKAEMMTLWQNEVGSPPVGWLQGSETEPSTGGLHEELEARAISHVSLMDFQLDGGVELSTTNLNEQFRIHEGIKVFKFSDDQDLPLLVIQPLEGEDPNAQSLKLMPRTAMPPSDR
ncbi:DNA-directed RNA polymerase III subunit RPC5 [Globomyces sp. JEL0801]|nr:DNA-directed RNA polymerase III subunit RPC5 [Globomyces sp. JEL0801]